MNKIFLSHFSAFDYYRKMRSLGEVGNLKPTNNISGDINITNGYIKNAASLLCNSQKIDVLLNSKNQCFKSQYVRRHYYEKSLPSKSFWKVDDKLSIVCPELLFCQMANYLNAIELLLLGLEMCGSFSLINNEKGFVSNLPPISSTRKIKAYVQRLKRADTYFKGINRAIKISALLQDGSASPQESRLYVLLCAPRNMGGYGLKNVQLNKKIKLSKKACAICGQNFLIPDLCVVENKIAIEYDSDAFHDNAKQNSKDKQRIDAYIYDG